MILTWGKQQTIADLPYWKKRRIGEIPVSWKSGTRRSRLFFSCLTFSYFLVIEVSETVLLCSTQPKQVVFSSMGFDDFVVSFMAKWPHMVRNCQLFMLTSLELELV